MAGCIDRGLDHVRDEQVMIRRFVAEVGEVAATLDPKTGDVASRKETFEGLRERFREAGDPTHQRMAVVMTSFLAGLFVGEGVFATIRDNLDLERWFRLPKGHERRIHGHSHAGIRLVREGPTLMMVLDAHRRHPAPFTAEDLLPYYDVAPPACQVEAEARHAIMRRASSRKQRTILLADFEERYRRILDS